MHQRRKAKDICVDKEQVIGSSLKLGSCLNTLHINADALLNRGSDGIDQKQLHGADDRNTIHDTFFKAEESGAKREKGNKDTAECDTAHPAVKTRNTEEELEETRAGATCRPRKRVMFDVDSSEAASSEFVDSSLTSVSSLESNDSSGISICHQRLGNHPVSTQRNRTRESQIATANENDTSTANNFTVTLGWFGGVRQSNAICDEKCTTGTSESSMVNNTIRTTQENINISQQSTKRNKPLYRVNKSTVTYNNKFYKVTGSEVDNSRKDNTEIKKIPSENKEEDTSQVGDNKPQSESSAPVQRQQQQGSAALVGEQSQANPTVINKAQLKPLGGLGGHNSDKADPRPDLLTDQLLTYESKVTSGEFIISTTKEPTTVESPADIGKNCKQIIPLIHTNCVNPEIRSKLRSDRVTNRDRPGQTVDLLPHSSYIAVNGGKRSDEDCSPAINDRCANRKTNRLGSTLFSGDNVKENDSDHLFPLRVDAPEEKNDIESCDRHCQLNGTDSLLKHQSSKKKDGQENNSNLNLDIDLNQLEENIEAEFDELNAKMDEFDFEERETILYNTPETPRRRHGGRHRSESDSDGTECHIEMERQLEGAYFFNKFM